MSGIENIIGIIVGPALKLTEYISRRSKSEQLKNDLFDLLQIEIESYIKATNLMHDVFLNEYVVKIEELSNIYSYTLFNDIIQTEARYLFQYDSMLKSQIDIARSCYDIYDITSMMDELKNYNKETYQFVESMKLSYKTNDTISIDGKFLKSMQRLGSNTFKKIPDEEVKASINKMEKIVEKIRNVINPTRSKGIVDRKIDKEHKYVVKNLVKTMNRIKVDKRYVNNIRNYVPKKFLPLIVTTEELMKEQIKDKECYNDSASRIR